MITHIRMKNFKSWKDSGEVKLAPLTGFFGTNSSGKSSLLQMLLLLKQTVERADPEDVIFFGDKNSYVNLGDFIEVIHGRDFGAELYFMIGAKLSPPNPIKDLTLMHFLRFTFETVIRENDERLYVDSLQYINLSNRNKFSWTSEHLLNSNMTALDINFKNCYGLIASNEREELKRLVPFITMFERLFSQIFYLGPTRALSLRKYYWEGNHPIDIGRWGDKTIDALLSARVDRKTIQHDEGEVSIEEKISEWLREMHLAHTFILERIEQQGGRDYDVRLQMKEYGPKIALADMGYGLSQFLPVLVLCYYAPEGSTLILEQPGIHLHPMVQAQLADLLIEVVNERKLQILVESHSEHLLTRLQRRLVEQQIAQDDVALYFCRNREGASTIDKLDIDAESGDIKNWPENFFGDVMGDMIAMTDKQVETIAEKDSEG